MSFTYKSKQNACEDRLFSGPAFIFGSLSASRYMMGGLADPDLPNWRDAMNSEGCTMPVM